MLLLSIVHSSDRYAGEIQRQRASAAIYKQVAGVLADADIDCVIRVEFAYGDTTAITIRQAQAYGDDEWINNHSDRFKVEDALIAAVNRGFGSAVQKRYFTIETSRPVETAAPANVGTADTDTPDVVPNLGRRRPSRSERAGFGQANL